MYKVSLIVPVYNTEEYLEKCLDSLVNQTLEEIEIIIVNDGSPDNSQQIIDEYVKKYPDKVKGISQDNAGLSGARNSGLNIAQGEYIAFVDSDDFVELETYEKVYGYAKENNLDIVNFGYKELRDSGIVDAVSNFNGFKDVSRYMIEQTMAWNKLFKRDLFVQNDIKFTEKIYYEDLELIPRLVLLTDKIGCLDEYLYYYVIRNNSIMRQQKFNNKFRDIYSVVKKLNEELSESNYKQELEYLYIEHLLFSAAGRFIEFKEGKDEIKNISRIMKEQFPNWKNNVFFNHRRRGYKLFCLAAYYRMIPILKLLKKIREMV